LVIIAELEQVVTVLERGRAYKISNILLLELEKYIEERKEALSFLLCFLLVTRMKATFSASGTSMDISTSGKSIEMRLEPWIVLIASTRVEVSS